jgi:hypothetical protein
MKRCPKCNRTYSTNTQKFCTHDGGVLIITDSTQPETVRINTNDLDDAPTKAISRELVSEVAAGFDPFKTVISSGQTANEPAAPVRETQDLDSTPTTTIQPPEPPPAAVAPPPPSAAPPAPPVQSPPPVTPSVPPFAAPSPTIALTGSGPIAAAPPQFAAAPQQSPQQPPPTGTVAPKKKSKLPLVLGILAVLFILFVVFVAVAYIFVVKPRLEARRLGDGPVIEQPRPRINEPTPNVGVPSDSPANLPVQVEPPPYTAPADAVQFVNSDKELSGKLAEHYVDFSFYYPVRWTKDATAGVAGATNFAKVERRLPPDFTQENFAVGSYQSAGSSEADRTVFPTLAESMSAQFEKKFPGYKKVSEGPTKVSVYDAYEFRFESLSQNTAKGDVKVWGRVIFVPPVDGSKNGVTLLMLATSLAPELRSVDDVGVKGELPMMLESFRFGKK